MSLPCWLHFFIESERGWLQLPLEGRMPHEEPLSMCVLLTLLLFV